MFTEEQGRLLLQRARNVIARDLGEHPPLSPHPDWLEEPGAVFVTLTDNGRLRGCIGSLQAHRKLGDDLDHNAHAAAFADPRFPRLTPAELERVRVEVSILTPAQDLHFHDEEDALAQLRPGVDGVILEAGWHRATFLPQVWEQLPNPRQFLSHLKQKAGLAPDFWSADVRLSRYQVRKFKEAR